MKRVAITPADITPTPRAVVTTKRLIQSTLLVLAVAYASFQPAMAQKPDWHVEDSSGQECVPVSALNDGKITREIFNSRVQLSSEQAGIYHDPKVGPRVLGINKAKCMSLLTRMRGPQSQDDMQMVAEILAEQNAKEKQAATQQQPKQVWYAGNTNFTDCIEARMSPAQRIRELQNSGRTVSTKDGTDRNGNLISVEVSYLKPNGDEQYWTYYRTKSDCLATIPNHQPVNPKYE